jgi:hypothetical protein
LAVVLAGAAEVEPGGKSKKVGDAVAQLIKDLGSSRYRTREVATQKLGELGEGILPALRKGAASPDLETRRRCRLLIGRIEIRAAEAVIAKWRKKMPDFLDRLAKDEQFATREHIDQLWEFVEFIAEQASKAGGRPFHPPPRLKVANLGISRKNESAVVGDTALFLPFLTGPRVYAGILSEIRLHRCLLVAGPPPHKGTVAGLDIWDSVVFVVGNPSHCATIHNSIVICQGNMPATNVKNSIVLVTGHLDTGAAQNSFFEVGDFRKGVRSANNVYFNLPMPTRVATTQNDLLTTGPSLLKIFKSSK